MKKRYYYREKKYKYVEDDELVSITEVRVKSELVPPDSGEILKQDLESPHQTEILNHSSEETVFLR